MSMDQLEVELPEDDDVDAAFKRRIALLVAVIAFFGTIASFLASHASTEEAKKMREAQRASVAAVGQGAGVAARTLTAGSGAREAEAVGRLASLARSRAFFNPGPDSAPLNEQAHLFEEAEGSLAGLSPLLSDAAYRDRGGRYAEVLDTGPNRLLLSQEADREAADAWGDREIGYVAVITFLAVALALLGLSVTIGGRARLLLVVPAIAITAACTVAIVWNATRPVPRTSQEAISHVVEGDLLSSEGDYKGAIRQYSRAIDLRPDYVTALGKRASAHFSAGSPQGGQYRSVTSREANAKSVDDLERALKHGGRDRPLLVADLGFGYFLQRKYGDAEKQTRRALGLGRQPAVQANLALILAAQGRARAAGEAYATAIEEIGKRPLREEQDALFSGALNDLELLARRSPERSDLVRRFADDLVAGKVRTRVGETLGRPPEGVDFAVRGITFRASTVQIDLEYRNIPAGTRVGYVSYVRANEHEAWRHAPELDNFEVWRAEPTGRSTVQGNQGGCPTAGQYRIDVYAEGQRVTTAEAIRTLTGGHWVFEEEAVSGFGLCRPSSLEAQAKDAGSLRLGATDGAAQVSVRVDPRVTAAEGTDARGAAAAALAQMTEASGLLPRADGQGAQEVVVGWVERTGDRRGLTGFYDVYARADQPDQPVAIWASVGPDAVLRTVVLTAPRGELERLANDVLFSFTFRERPT
jgi:tetratricopeptide (TPR) repeat protein